jgi:aminoglycoside phosphotransferase family enzyme/predicted kinase
MSELPELIQTLLRSQAYPEKTGKIELVQTQMSFILLSDKYAYKVKKPVNLGYLDYTTLEKRLFFCQREIELNKRLCPETYLKVAPITRDESGIAIDGKGEIVEYAVKMRRLSEKSMLNSLLAADQVTTEMLAEVAKKLAAFHKKAEANAEISSFGSIETIRLNTSENFDQTDKYFGATISEAKFRHIKAYTERFIKDNTALFNKRIAEGRIRDCHGDLHAAHICFSNGICIYDCIEFNDRFRYSDTAAEVAFLAMDLDHYGRANLSRSFVNAYIASSRDKELKKLLNFYKCYRAYVRGKVESFKLDDPYITAEEKRKIREVASSYFDLAYAYTHSKPVLFITVGLIGSGKSTLAQALAKRLGLVVISSDRTRKRLAGIPSSEHRFAEFDSGIYSAEFSRLTYDTMFGEARNTLSEGDSLIIDASFIKAKERLKAKELAEEANADFIIIECILDETTTKERLERRLKEGSTSDGRWELFSPQKKTFEPVAEAETKNYVLIDSTKPADEAAAYIADKII